jgi:hypothetical protein
MKFLLLILLLAGAALVVSNVIPDIQRYRELSDM